VPGEPITLRVALRNTGARTGRQVVQAYLSFPGSTVERPVRWLAGFASATVPAGAEQRVEITLHQRLFVYWDATERDWMLEPGTYTVQVGFSSADLPLRADILIG
jgi:beta-glucosidase